MPAPRSFPPPGAEEGLAALAGKQGGLFRWAQAVDAGFTAAQIRTRLRSGSWIRVRHGVLVTADVLAATRPHLLECAARWLDLPADVVVSHASAAVLHGFPLVIPPGEPVFTSPRAGRGSVWRPAVGELPDAHREHLFGLPVTTAPRTLVDVLRTVPDRYRAQEVADAVRGAGPPMDGVAGVLDLQRGWPGIRQAREAWHHASALSESALESRCRVWFRDGGLPEPEQQVRVTDARGRFVARVDFLFRAQGTVVEPDGRVKYETPAALWDEKRREDRLRDLGFEVVRATWADGEDGGQALVERVLRAFGRARRAG